MSGSTYLWALLFVILISAVAVACAVGIKVVRSKQEIKRKNQQKRIIKQKIKQKK